MKSKEQYEFPVTVFDTLLSEYDIEDGLYLVKCYFCEYLIGRNSHNLKAKLNFVPSCLKESLETDLFQLFGRCITLWEWLKSRDFKGVRYDYEWEDLNKAFNEADSLKAFSAPSGEGRDEEEDGMQGVR